MKHNDATSKKVKSNEEPAWMKDWWSYHIQATTEYHKEYGDYVLEIGIYKEVDGVELLQASMQLCKDNVPMLLEVIQSEYRRLLEAE